VLGRRGWVALWRFTTLSPPPPPRQDIQPKIF
ncbi:hypothetical protein ACVWZI_002587, partial [Thermostichus sp. OS-CIW-28]